MIGWREGGRGWAFTAKLWDAREAGLVVVVQVSVEDPDVLLRLVVVAVEVVVVVVVDDAVAVVGAKDLLASAGASGGRLAPTGASAAAGNSGSGGACLLPPAARDRELRSGAARAGPTLVAVDGRVAGLTDGGLHGQVSKAFRELP